MVKAWYAVRLKFSVKLIPALIGVFIKSPMLIKDVNNPVFNVCKKNTGSRWMIAPINLCDDKLPLIGTGDTGPLVLVIIFGVSLALKGDPIDFIFLLPDIGMKACL